jgi:hypothetical protein
LTNKRALHLAGILFATVLVHLWLIFEASLQSSVMPLNDLNLYGSWMTEQQFFGFQEVYGLTRDWVYPFVAQLPMLLAAAIGGGSGLLNGWLALVTLLNLLAIGELVGWGRGAAANFKGAWFWLLFMALLGPVAIGRIDSVATVLAVFGLVALARNRLTTAMILFTSGAWMKIWPVALALAVFLADKRRKLIFLVAAATSAIFLALGALLGGGLQMFSFIFTQGDRALQIEAPIATIWLWLAKFNLANSTIYFDNNLLTNQIAGLGALEVSALMTPVMVGALAITAWLGFRGHKAGAPTNHLFAAIALTATLDLIVFNKVGSPQFEGWLAVPLIAGIIFKAPKWRTAVLGGLVIALLTNLVYPVFYMDLMGLGWLSLITLTLRNLALIWLLVWANKYLAGLAEPMNQEVRQSSGQRFRARLETRRDRSLTQ